MTADITKTVAPKTDQLNADDLFAGRTMDLTITGVRETGAKEQPIAISYEGDNGKPWKPSLGMRRVLLEIWGQEAGAESDKFYRGRRVRLFRDPDVKFGKDTVGGIRISHASDIRGDVKIALTVAKGRRVEFVVHPLKDAPAAKQATQSSSAPVQSSSAPATTSGGRELTENQKNFIRIREAINASPDDMDLFDLWHNGEVGYSKEIELIKQASQAKYDELKKIYDDKKMSFQAG